MLLICPILLMAQKKEVVLGPWTPTMGTNPSLVNREIDPTTQKFVMQGVVDIPGDRNALYDRALAFLARGLGNSNWAIQIRDKENGKIVSKSSVVVPYNIGNASANITLLFKDNKFKYIITDFFREDYVFMGSKYRGWRFEDEVNFLLNDITKKKQIEVRQSVFDAYDDVIEKLKKDITVKKSEFDF